MPVIKSAIKKLRKDRKREIQNDGIRRQLDLAVRGAQKTKTAKSVSGAVSLIDKAVKKHLIHENRAARMKSKLSKLAKPAASTTKKIAESTKKPAAKTTKKTPAKSPKK